MTELELAVKFFGCSDGSDMEDGEYKSYYQKSLIAWYRWASKK